MDEAKWLMAREIPRLRRYAPNRSQPTLQTTTPGRERNLVTGLPPQAEPQPDNPLLAPATTRRSRRDAGTGIPVIKTK